MCCSPGHYPAEAGIFRTDIVGHHQHYGNVVTTPNPNGELGENGLPKRDVFSTEEWFQYDRLRCSDHDDHWHANMPLQLTACISNEGVDRFALRGHDWFRYYRETSMGIERDHVSGPSSGPGNIGSGYDFTGLFICTSPDQMVEVREQVLMAIAEGVDMTQEALWKVVQRYAGVRIRMFRNGKVTRQAVPTLDEWRRGNPFVKPPLNENDLLYASDMDGYTMTNHGAGASGLWLRDGSTFADYMVDEGFDPKDFEWAPQSLEEFKHEATVNRGVKTKLYQPDAGADPAAARAAAAPAAGPRRGTRPSAAERPGVRGRAQERGGLVNGIDAPEVARVARELEQLAEDLGKVLDRLEAQPDNRRPIFVQAGRFWIEEMLEKVAELRQPLVEDGRDPKNGRLMDPLEARRRRAANRGWKPSRHPEMDEEFFRRKRPWPNGARLHLKRFNENGDHETAHIEVSIEYAERGTVFKLHQLPGARDRRGAGADSMVTADELLADRWEVD